MTREKGPTELFVTRQGTCYKWKPLLRGLLGRERREHAASDRGPARPLFSGMPGNILERVGRRNRRENLSEAISSLPGVLALLCDRHFVLRSSGKMFPPKLPEMHIWI